jgi:hypothetical protein
VCGRDATGIRFGLSNKTNAFGATVVYTGAFGDSAGGSTPAVYRTIRFPTVTSGTCVSRAGWAMPWLTAALSPRN